MYALLLTTLRYLTAQIYVIILCSVLCLVSQPCLTLCESMDYSPPGSSIPGILQVRILEWIAIPSSRELRSPSLQADALPPEPPRKPMNTGVGGLSLFQRIFHIAGEFFTSWATRDAQLFFSSRLKMFSLWLVIGIIFYFLSDLIVKTDKNLLLLWLCNYYLF